MKKHIKIQKKKLKIYNPKLGEECGVFGVSNAKDASALTALGLHALQHRGQESSGIYLYCKQSYIFQCILSALYEKNVNQIIKLKSFLINLKYLNWDTVGVDLIVLLLFLH